LSKARERSGSSDEEVTSVHTNFVRNEASRKPPVRWRVQQLCGLKYHIVQ